LNTNIKRNEETLDTQLFLSLDNEEELCWSIRTNIL